MANDDGQPAPSSSETDPLSVREPSLAGFAGEVSWTYLAAGLAAVTNIGVLAFALRRLSAVEFGTYAVVSMLAQLLTVLDFALSTTAVRAAATFATAGDPDEREDCLRTIRSVHACNLGLTGVLVAVTAAGATVVALGQGPAPAALTGLMGAAISLNTGTAVLVGVATGARRFRSLALTTLTALAASALVVVLLIGPFGVVALGAAELCRVVVSRGLIAGWVRPIRPLGLPSRPSLASLREIARPARSLVAISAAGLAISTTDVLLLGALAGSRAAGAYRVGSLLPAQATALLFRGYDAAFPLLAGARDPLLQTQVTRLLTRFFSVLAAAGLGAAALHASLVIRAFSGTSDPLSSRALTAFCVVWSINVVIHGPALHLLSRGGEALLTRVVLAELGLNLLLTIGLVIVIGPLGAAIASVVAVAASNLILAPVVMRRLLGPEVGRTIWFTGSGGLLAGTVAAVLGSLAAAPLSNPLVRLSVTLVVTLACAGAAIALLATKEERGLLAGSVGRRVDHPSPLPEA